MADRGFAVQDLCALKGVHLNLPAQKMSDQFTQAEVASNFDIASTRIIHVERFIGRVREWSILNVVWPVQPDNAPYWSQRKQIKADGL